jgi:MFS family permease
MGAAFGLGFLVGPALGAIFSELIGIEGTIIACIVVIFLNVLAINFLLEEPKKHVEQENVDFFEKFSFSRDVVILFSLTF